MSENTCSWYGILAAIMLAVGLFIVADQRDALKQEAVDHGYAEWIVIGVNETEFKWKQNQYTAPNLSNK